MTSRIESVSSLTKSALKVDAQRFLYLIQTVTQQLVAEDEKLGTLKIMGRFIEAPATGEAIIVGDLHGDLKSLVHILENSKIVTKLNNHEDVLLVFLGDYGDRGRNTVEVYHVILTLKSLFPEPVILLRGNHEGPPDLKAWPHDLPKQLEQRFENKSKQIYNSIQELFSNLYVCVVIKENCVLVHGGAPCHAKSISDIAFAHKKHPQTTVLEEILWNDPLPKLKGSIASPRGAGRLFGQDTTNKLLKLVNVKTLIRGHQPCPDGYKTDHNNKVLTLFSRKGTPYYNRNAAYLHVDFPKKLENSKQLLECLHKF